jgi:hypothetical protein
MMLGREDKLDQLERILQSRTMQGSENLKSFLNFVVNKSLADSGDQLKEYTIATEVFGRSNDFSPRHDSVVRVQASRLRLKLQEYYTTEGKADRVLIELPKGHYIPFFSEITRAASPNRESVAISEGPFEHPTPPRVRDHPRKRRSAIALGASAAVLFIVVIALGAWNLSLRQQIGQQSAQDGITKFGHVWEPFLRAEDPTLLVLSNPAVYRFTNPKDPETVLKDSVTLTPSQIKRLEEILGDKFMIRNSPGRLIISGDQFTGIGEAIGLYRVTDLFRSAGRGLLLKQSRTVSAEDLKNHNVIHLGSVWVNEWSGKLPIKEDFAYTRNATIANLNPVPGEEREYASKFDSSGRLIEDYALITVKPNISDRNTVMILAGIYSEGTEAAAEYAASLQYLNNLNQRLAQFSPPPRYYQALLKVAVDNGIPTTVSLVSLHELQSRE